jgi:hypothetical protein
MFFVGQLEGWLAVVEKGELMKVRIVLGLDVTVNTLENHAWSDAQQAWFLENMGEVVTGRMVECDEFQPDNLPEGVSIVLYSDEYELLEEDKADVLVRMSPQEDGTVIYFRCTQDTSFRIEAREAFFLMLNGCKTEIILKDPHDDSHYEGNCILTRI